MTDRPRFSVVLPAFLEEENLRLLLPRIRTEMDHIGAPFEIIVVDTPTPLDATAEVCQDNGVTYVNRAPRDSFGDAVRTGITAARGDWVIFMDADGSHTPEFIRWLVAETPAYDVVIASRYVAGGFTENSRALVLMSRVLNLTYSLVLNVKCKDVSNSFKIYRAELLKPLVLRCDNFDIVEEIIFKMCRRTPSLKIKEVAFTFKKRMFGETKRNLFLFIVTYVVTMVRLRLSAADG